MKRRRAWAGLGVLPLALAALGVWVTLGAGDAPPRGGVLGETASSAPADVAPQRVRIGATSLFDLAHGAPLVVRVPGPGTVRATITPSGGEALSLGRARAGAARMRVAARVAASLDACRRARLTVTVTDGDGKVTARRSRTLAPQPPACGRFFGSRAVWNTRVERAPLDPLSPTLVADLVGQVEANFAANFAPTINAVNYSAPVYTVPASQRRVPVKLVGGREQYGQALARQLAAGVPIPRGARAAWGNDHHLVVWQPATDTMWELWDANTDGTHWTAQWGGRMDAVSRSPGYFSDPSGIQPGATATSLPLAGGLITRADLARGEIDHALAIALPNSRADVWSRPAQRTDGAVPSETAIPAGARFRLDPTVDVDALDVPPFTKLLARAAQRYGLYVRDTSATVTFYAEDPVAIGSDPWTAAIQPSAAEVLRAFPWKDLQVTRMDLWTYSNQRVAR